MYMYRLYFFSLPLCQELDCLIVAAPLLKLLLIKFRHPEVFKVHENILLHFFLELQVPAHTQAHSYQSDCVFVFVCFGTFCIIFGSFFSVFLNETVTYFATAL